MLLRQVGQRKSSISALARTPAHAFLTLSNGLLLARKDQALGSPEVRNFTGSLKVTACRRRVLITTSKFTKDPIEFAKRLQQKKLVLIDGEKLTELMMDFGVGVSRVATYTVQKIDPDYFGEE